MTKESLLQRPARCRRTWLIAAILAVIALVAALGIGMEDSYAGEYEGTVYFNLTDDGLPVISDGEESGVPMMMVSADLQDVADVDLSKWELEDYTYHDYETGEEDPGRPTVLKLHLLMLERYKADPYSTDTITVTGATNSAYMNRFWGHDENLNYYVNGAYPLFEGGWGGTCDGIALEDGDRVDMMMFSDGNFWGDESAGFNFFADAESAPEDGQITGSYQATAGTPLPVQVIRGWGDLMSGGSTAYQAADDLTIHVSGKDSPIDLSDDSVGTLNEGRAELTFDEPGTYYVWVEGGTGGSGTPVQSGAAAKVVVKGAAPKNVLPIGFSTSNGSVDTLTITDGSGNVIENAEYEVVPGASAGNYTVNVTLPKSFNASGSVKGVFAKTSNTDGLPFLTPNNAFNRAFSSRTDTYTATLSSGRAAVKAYLYDAKPKATSNKYTTITINYAVDNAKPKLSDGTSAEAEQSVTAGDAYEVDLSTIFTDDDGDALSYKVAVNGTAAVSADTNYSFTTDQMGTYSLVFTANDGQDDSEDTYTVNLTVTRKAGTYYVTHTNGTGYTTEAAEGSSSPVNEGGSYRVKLTLAAGYQRGADFAVKANGVALAEDSEGGNTFTATNVTEDLEITVEGVVEQSPVIIAPMGSRITVGYQTGYFKKTWIAPIKTETLLDGRVKNTYAPVSNGQLFYRVQNPKGVTYYKFITAMNRGDEIEVTADKLFINDPSYTSKTKRDRSGNIADVYLPINAAGYVNLASGAESTLNCFRNWLPVNSTISNDKEGIPDFHYEVVDENGNASDLVTIEPDVNNSGVAKLTAGNGSGMAIVKVTYDAMYVDGNNNFGPRFGAIWPERTGVFVVTVGQDGTGVRTNMNIDQVNGSARAIDAEHDPLFYVGDEGAEYSFTPESGTTVTVARPTVGTSTLTYSGFSSEGVNVDSDGKVTVSGLVTGRNIIRVAKGETASYQVITAQQVSWSMKDSKGNAIDENAKLAPGTAVTLTFSGLTSPSEKFSGKYNFNFRVGLKGENGTLFQEASPGGFGVYNFTTKDHSLTATIPEDWTKTTYKLNAGGIIKGGLAGGDGTHRTSTYGAGGGMAWGSEGTGASAYGGFPAITLNVQQPPVRKEGVEAEANQDLTVGEAYSVDLSDIFEDPNGDALTYSVSVNGADPVAAEEKYAYTPAEAGSVTLLFRASDGTADSTDTFTVNLTVAQAHQHDWGEPTYTWNEDNTKVTAKRVCKDDPSHVEEEDATVTVEQTKAPTCEGKGERTYTSAAFTNDAFEVQIKKEDIDRLDHDWGEWTVTRKPTETADGEETRVCKTDPSHKETRPIAKLKPGVKPANPNAVPTTKPKAKPTAKPTTKPTKPVVTTIVVNVKTVNRKAVDAAVKKAGATSGGVTTIVLGKKVKKIKKNTFKTYGKVNTLVVKTKKLKKKSVKGSLKGSAVKTVKVKVGGKKANKKYVKKYKKIFTKKNAGKKVRVKR